MKLEGTYEFTATREVVWEMLQDPEVMGSIIPGSQGMDKVAENQYETAVVVKVGPVTGRFEGSIQLSSLSPPESYTLTMMGKGPVGHVTGEGSVRLEYDGNVTTMHYIGDATVGGRIATVGQRLLDIAAKAIAKQSLNSLARRIQERIEEAQ